MIIQMVFSQLNDIYRMIAYAAGFSFGNFIGSYIEELIAIGEVSVQIILDKDTDLADTIRKWGFGVTCLECIGKEGDKEMLFIESGRRRLPALIRDIKHRHPNAFITITDTKKIINGYFDSHPYSEPKHKSLLHKIGYIFSGNFK